MKKRLLFSLLLTSFITVSGLSQNPIWTLPTTAPGSGYYDFSDEMYKPFPTVDPITGVAYPEIIGPDGGYVPDDDFMYNIGTSNAYHDQDGKLLFFIVGDNIFDGDGRTIWADINDSDGSPSGNQITSGYSDICVVPNPANCNQYYLFTAKDVWYNSAPFGILSPYFETITTVAYYAILDISEPNEDIGFNTCARGRLIQPFQSLVNLAGYSHPSVSKLSHTSFAASKESPIDGSRVVLALTNMEIPGEAHRQQLLKFRLDGSGINYVGYQDLYDESNTLGGGSRRAAVYRGELELLELGNGNYRVAYANTQQIVSFDLDPITLNQIGTESVFPYVETSASTGRVRGIEIVNGLVVGADDGRYIYFTNTEDNATFGSVSSILPFRLNCWDLTTNSLVSLPYEAAISSEYEYSHIEMGTDGNLYLAINDRLSQISSPQTPGTSIFNPTFKSISYPANYFDYSVPFDIAKLYPLPDQIDGMNYNDHLLSTCACCVETISYDTETGFGECAEVLDFPLTDTWTAFDNPFNGGTGADAYIEGDLIIPANANITIIGMTLHFHPDSRVIIERSDDQSLFNGAKLTLNTTTLTSDDRCCPTMWQGVVVQGFEDESQYPLNNSKQGYLLMTNNSVIENAMIGAEATYIGEASEEGGGIIRAYDSEFRNNRYDVRIWRHENFYPWSSAYADNLCYFHDTKFITDGLLNDPAVLPKYHAMIYIANGVKFQGCTFENVDPNVYTEGTRGYGIFNIRSKLTVNPSCASFSYPCSSPVPNEFINLRYGIYCVSGNSLTAIKIDQNEFVNNLFGVYIGGIDFPIITRNNFQIDASTNPDFDLGRTYGIYLAGSSGFTVQENDLREFDDPGTVNGQTRGIIVTNSGEGEEDPLDPYDIPHNEIYKNDFTDLLIGGQSQGVNSPEHFPPGTTDPVVGGLQWLCNQFNSQINADLYVSSGRIDYEQGFYANPFTEPAVAPYAGARNFLSTADGGADVAAVTGVESFVYTHYQNTETTPVLYSFPTVAILEIPMTISYSTSCPSKILDGFVVGSPIAYINVKKQESKDEIDARLELIDGGDTDGMLTLIETGSNGSVKNALMESSPYLSDEVLLAYIASNPPNGHLKQVIMANSPVSQEVLNAYLNTNPPGGHVSQVNGEQDGISEMTTLENSINYYRRQREYWVDESIKYYLHDTLSENPMDSVIAILIEEDRPIRREQLCDAYIINGDLANATIVRNEIVAENGGETNYTRIAEVNIDTRFATDPLEVINSDSLLVNELNNIAVDNNDGRICPRGEALLYDFIYADAIYHLVEPYWTGGLPKMYESFEDESNQEKSVLVYPNPTSNNVFIEIQGYEELDEVYIQLFDMTGKLIMSYQFPEGTTWAKIDISSIPNGVYLVNTSSSNEVLAVSKLIKE